jgi:DeoR family transcriptional regulator, suf operon transcriptional repressor
MNDTRRAVLEHIHANGQATVQRLADTLGISPISVRHHLTSLQAAGLVRIELERQAVGRPKYRYLLTERALDHFPQQYQTLVIRLLDELKATFPADQVESIIERVATNAAAHYGTGALDGTLEQRLARLVTILGAEGFMAEVQRVDDHMVLTAQNCPYTTIGHRHPELCRIDSTLIQTVLGGSVQQTACVLQGDRSCAFSVQG